MALSSVDFPEPLVPMTITKEPSSIEISTLCKERTSLGVPALNVLAIRCVSSMGRGPCPNSIEFGKQGWQNQSEENESGRDQLQVVRIESPAQSDGNEEAEEYGT